MKAYDFAKLIAVNSEKKEVIVFYNNEIMELQCLDAATLCLYQEELLDNNPIFVPFNEDTKMVIMLEEGDF